MYAFIDRPPSTDPSLCFSTDVRVTWRRLPDATASTGPQFAARLVRPVIDEAAADCSVLRLDAAEQDITTALCSRLPLSGDGVEVVDVRVRLSVDAATRNAALRDEQLRQQYRREEALRAERLRAEYEREQERLRRECELDALARRQAREREDFLRGEILASPASARLYTLLERSVEHWPRLGGPEVGTDLVALVREVQLWQPENRWVTVAQLLHGFVTGLSEENRKELLTILADAVKAFGDEALARRLAAVAGESE
ncbi:hypothetical protein [Streptomyces albidoflavus]|uniref:hypothetical protein n=1 Tax=Streptomyces albidoflavus TaxID=1886 RepID=UPI0033C6E29B